MEPNSNSPIPPGSTKLTRAKRASVLLLTVVILLILSILATAYLATTRVDRITSAGDVTNAQIDQLVDGVKDMAIGYIVNSLFAYNNFSGYQYRAANSGANATTYNNYDAPDYLGAGASTCDLWLADRVPQMATVNGVTAPTWMAITGSLSAQSYNGGPNNVPQFEFPAPPMQSNHTTFEPSTTYNAPFYYSQHTNLQPTFVSYTPAGSTTSVTYPAFTVTGTATNTTGTTIPMPNVLVIAGDADGDGIADCGLFRLPGAYNDTLTYYAGIRIVDNAAAININTAWDDRYDYNFSGGPIAASNNSLFPSLFPSAVGLLGVLDATNPSAEIALLNNFRLGGYVATQNQPITDLITAPTDFAYATEGDAMYHQLSRRLGNPGYRDATGDRYRAIGEADTATLAYHGGLLDPGEYPALSSNNVLPPALTVSEDVLSYSAFADAPNSRQLTIATANPINLLAGWRSYPAPSEAAGSTTVASDASLVVNQWYSDNFNGSALAASGTPAPAGTVNARPLLVTRNGVSITAPAKSPTALALTVANAAMAPYGDRGRWQPNVQYNHTNPLSNGTSQYVSDDCVTFAAGTATALGASPMLPANAVSTGTFSGVFFARAANTNQPPTGLAQEAINSGGSGNVYWARPTYWNSTQSYNLGDYVYTDGYTTGEAAGDQYHFYRALQPNTDQVPTTVTANSNWAVWQPPPNAVAVKANVNTATFPELFRGYWNVMAGVNNAGAAVSPFDAPTANGVTFSSPADLIYRGSQFTAAYPGIPNPAFHPERMFRSPVRDPRVSTAASPSGWVFDPTQVLLLRAAIAAVNTENLRAPLTAGAPTANITARQIPLVLNVDGTYTDVNVTIYGNQPQVFITEIYAQTNLATPEGGFGPNPDGYIAIELYNPNPIAVTLTNWQIAGMTRTTYAKKLNSLYTFPAGAVIAPNGYMLLENFTTAPGPTDITYARFRPASSGIVPANTSPATNFAVTNDLYVQNLYQVIQNQGTVGSELVFLRPRNTSSNTLSSGTDGNYSWNETSIYDMVPVDSFDFAGIDPGSAPGVTPGHAQDLHYQRANGPNEWQFVYPGRYDGSQAVGRQQGTQLSVVWDPNMLPDPGTVTPGNFGSGNANNLVDPTGIGIRIFSVQPTNSSWAGLNKSLGTTGNQFPFGGFARNGDILEVPYIAAYRITDLNGYLVELNSITMDAAFAEDTDTTDDVGSPAARGESIGRFCPLIPPPSGINDGSPTGPNMRYGWARDLFDYLTVQDPRDDYLPSADPENYPRAASGPPPAPPYPMPVANADSSLSTNLIISQNATAANTEAENTQTVQGLVNINTAPLQVLAQLPLAVKTDGTIDSAENFALAQAIINYRQTTGPFTSIFDLNAVQNFPAPPGDITSFSGTSTTAGQGNITPGSGVPYEFDETYLQITRLSNLITTRSDSFTVYIIVEGWQNAGTPSAQLVVTRRAAFLVDRSGVTPASRAVRTVPVPTN